jgi:hypothetical protein
MLADLGVRLSIWMLQAIFSPSSSWESPMIPKKTIAFPYLLSLGLIIIGVLSDPHPPYSTTAHLPMLIGEVDPFKSSQKGWKDDWNAQ